MLRVRVKYVLVVVMGNEESVAFCVAPLFSIFRNMDHSVLCTLPLHSSFRIVFLHRLVLVLLQSGLFCTLYSEKTHQAARRFAFRASSYFSNTSSSPTTVKQQPSHITITELRAFCIRLLVYYLSTSFVCCCVFSRTD